MDPATYGTSIKKHNICHVFSSWKISRDLEKLTSAQAQLRSKIDMIARKGSKDMHQTKVTWLAGAKDLLLHAEILKTEINDAKQFLIWKQSRGLSDKFTKVTMAIQRKLEDANKLEAESVVGTVGYTVERKDDTESSLSSSSLSLPGECYILSKFARQAAVEIMKAFQDKDLNLIGLVGMAGVGKTPLAILMGMKAKESGMFDEVIKVSGRSSEGFKPDKGVIQTDIVKALDSKWNAREVGEDSSRTSELIGGIMKKVEKILIILDDVWEVFDLKAIGIPLGEDHKGSKVLLTTRLQHVCRDFGCQKTVHLGEKNRKLPVQENLPDAVFKLGSLPFTTCHYGNSDVAEEKTAKSLKLNYNYLNDKKMQSFFLLCSHFPRKYAHTVEELTRYGIGQGLFNDYKSIESTRKEAHSIISSLRSSLIVEDKECCVRMCDPFRMAALWVEYSTLMDFKTLQMFFRYWLQRDEEANFFASSTTIFLQTSKVFTGCEFFNLKFTNLLTLTIIEDVDRANFYEDRRFGSFSYMVKLKVLCLQASCFTSGDWAENPPTLLLEGIKNLKGLQTLQVKGYKVKCVSSLVELNKLEILGFLGCTFEDKLPEGLGELYNLKMLDFSYCVEFHEQPREWILKLSKLEELYITDVSLQVWSRSGFLRRLQEHNSGLSLTVLSPKVNSAFCLQQFVVPKFTSYWLEMINIKEEKVDREEEEEEQEEQQEEEEQEEQEEEEQEEEQEEINQFVRFKPISLSKALKIRALPMSPFVELFKDVEYLHLSDIKDCHNIVPSLDKGGLSGLQDLQLHGCKDLEYLIDEEGIGHGLVEVCQFLKLTNLELVGLAKLKSLWKGRGQMINLGNLKNFQLRDCNSLTGYIFSKLITQSLRQLEILEVNRCDKLEAMLEQCSDDDGPVCLPKLVTVKISHVNELWYVFPSYVIEGFPQLRDLQVSSCLSLKHVFLSSKNEVDGENEPDGCCHLELPQLRCLVLEFLRNLKTFSQGKDFIVAPLLEELQVEYCRNLVPFTLTLNNGMVPRLKKLHLISESSEVPEIDLDKAYTKMSKESTSGQHFIIPDRRAFDSRGTYFLSNLKELKLEWPDMRVLWKDSTINGLQNLTHLSLDGCLNLEYVFTPLSVHNMPHLKSLTIKSCLGLGQMVAEDETMTEAHGQQHRPIWFPNLTDIYIDNCPNLSNVFPARLADQLTRLKRLQVVKAESLTQIFGPEDSKETSNSVVVQLPLLQNLILERLTNMIRFAPEGLHFTFPALDHLEVRNCTKMQTSFYATKYPHGVCAITESVEKRRSVVDYAQPMNAAVAMPIFSGDNYKPWRNKMMTYFRSQGLWEVVEQGIKDDVPLEECYNEEKKDDQALFVIQNGVLDPIYSKISEATSARDAWLTLENLYSTVDDPHIRKLFSGNEQEGERWSNAERLKMDGDKNIIWPDGITDSKPEQPITVNLTKPDALRALDLILYDS